MKIRAIWIIFLFLNLYADDRCGKSISVLQELASKTSNLIKYGQGAADLVFNDEIINTGNGHCGQYVALMFNDIVEHQENGTLLDVDKMYVVGMESANGAAHAVLNISLSCGKTITCDPTNGFCYDVSIEDLIKNPSLADGSKLGKPRDTTYTTSSFFENIHHVVYTSYPGRHNNTINIAGETNNIMSNSSFYQNHGFDAVFDNNILTYLSEDRSSKETSMNLDFKNPIRLQSMTFYPYDSENRPTHVVVKCNDKIVKNTNIPVLRGGIMVVNFSGKYVCKNINLDFSQFLGQSRLILRDIKINGKIINKD